MSLVENIRKIQKKGLFPVISELKIRSKKRGDLLKGRDPLCLVKEMEKCPVAGISVVTERKNFGGSIELLKKVVSAVSLPVLHKDFIEDTYQIKESSKAGSSAILLISSILSRERLEILVEEAKRCGLEVLMEVHTKDDIEKIKDMDFDLLGINNRDIKILETDDTGVEHTERLIKECPKKVPIISESGIRGKDDVIRVKKAGADAVLVGTAVMLSSDIERFLKSLIFI